jgi:hypothetical protein
MNGGRIILTTSEQRRLIVLNHVESGALVNAEAARLLNLSPVTATESRNYDRGGATAEPDELLAFSRAGDNNRVRLSIASRLALP